MRSEAAMMAEILYLTVLFLLDKKRERIRASGGTGNLIQHIYIKKLKSCLESGIPTLNSYVRVIFS